MPEDVFLDVYDILSAFEAARAAAPGDKTLLRLWTSRYPKFADDLIAVDYARFAAGITLSDTLEEGPADEAALALARQVVAARRSDRSAMVKPPLTSLVIEATARGLNAEQFAGALRLDRLLLGRLEQRVLAAATLPLTLIRQIAEILERSPDEVAAFLRGSPRLAAQAHFRARQAPTMAAPAPMMSAPAPMPSFAEALELGQHLSDADKEYWRAEVDAGVLGPELR